jgi:hypothetical protein
MCVAGVRMDVPEAFWILLHPVPFRDLDNERKFAKYQSVAVDVIRPRSDRRPESWVPVHGTIQLGETIGTDDAWARRHSITDRLGEATMCELVAATRSGSGEGPPRESSRLTPELPPVTV